MNEKKDQQKLQLQTTGLLLSGLTVYNYSICEQRHEKNTFAFAKTKMQISCAVTAPLF